MIFPPSVIRLTDICGIQLMIRAHLMQEDGEPFAH